MVDGISVARVVIDEAGNRGDTADVEAKMLKALGTSLATWIEDEPRPWERIRAEIAVDRAQNNAEGGAPAKKTTSTEAPGDSFVYGGPNVGPERTGSIVSFPPREGRSRPPSDEQECLVERGRHTASALKTAPRLSVDQDCVCGSLEWLRRGGYLQRSTFVQKCARTKPTSHEVDQTPPGSPRVLKVCFLS